MLKVHKGFTLVEVMIVLAIIATLVGLGLPSYKESMNKARRGDAIIALEKAAAMQEQHFFQANQYAETVDDLGGVGGTLLSPEDNYSIATASVSVTKDFTLTATATSAGAVADEDCYYIRLSNTGVRTAHKKSDSGFASHQSDCLRD